MLSKYSIGKGLEYCHLFSCSEMQNCTPCVRAMVIQSDSLPVGSLFIITCTGGTIGRDTDLGHSIVIPDPLVSKVCVIVLSLFFFEDDKI